MAIMFSDIYDKAIGLFDDPKLKIAYKTNRVLFYKLMYPFLNNSFALFTNPLQVANELSDYTEPTGTMEIFESDGVTKEFKLSFKPHDLATFQFIANGSIVEAEYNQETNTVTFSEAIKQGQEYSVEAYFCGCFNSDFNLTNKTVTNNTIVLQVSDILARFVVIAWGENTRNFLLDIQNILTDTDFQLHPQSQALKSKIAWLEQLHEEICRFQNKLGMAIRFSNNANWGRRTW